MKLIFQGFGHAWAVELSFAAVKIRTSDELEASYETPEGEMRYDPHSTTAAHLERRSDIEDAAGIHARRFGFGSSQ